MHAASLEALADEVAASGFDGAGGDTEALCREAGVVHLCPLAGDVAEGLVRMLLLRHCAYGVRNSDRHRLDHPHREGNSSVTVATKPTRPWGWGLLSVSCIRHAL